MLAPRIKKGDTIGIFCPSHTADPERYKRNFEVIERLGCKYKLGANFWKDTYGYAASSEERAADLNALVADPEVKMILFSGGESAVEVLPFIDYGLIRKNPKIFSSYSDATSILLPIHAQTGLVTYYGFGVANLADLRYYDYEQFRAHFIEGYGVEKFVSDSNWRVLRGGSSAGTLIGGYTSLFALLQGNKYFNYDRNARHLLFLEDYQKFSGVGEVATYLAFIEQSEFMSTVTGLIFGHYSESVPDELLNLLKRFGDRNNIPVVYTDDFGHGTKHAILPIGINAALDADNCELWFKF